VTYPPTAPLQPPRRRLSTGVILGIVVLAIVGLLLGIFVVGAGVNNALDKGSSPSVIPAAAQTPANGSHRSPSPGPTKGGSGTPASADGATVVVPKGVGLDYQSAQDLWRAAGLHVAPATDATGAHRLPIVDSNWVVLSQDPPAGAVVDRGSFITATVKKYTDD
jgi:PASTA domain